MWGNNWEFEWCVRECFYCEVYVVLGSAFTVRFCPFLIWELCYWSYLVASEGHIVWVILQLSEFFISQWSLKIWQDYSPIVFWLIASSLEVETLVVWYKSCHNYNQLCFSTQILLLSGSLSTILGPDPVKRGGVGFLSLQLSDHNLLPGLLTAWFGFWLWVKLKVMVIYMGVELVCCKCNVFVWVLVLNLSFGGLWVQPLGLITVIYPECLDCFDYL